MTSILSRGPRKPVRLVHLGLGAFFRAHQARLTQLAEDGDDWGYAAFTVRSPRQAEILQGQDCLYMLIERSGDADDTHIVDQLSAVHDGADLDALCAYLRDPAVAVVTLTITEVGYAGGDEPQTRADLDLVRRRVSGEPVTPTAPLARLVVALQARRAADAGPLAIVPCDNLPENGEVARKAVRDYCSENDGLSRWIDENVSFVSTTVDRITPRLAAEEAERAAAASGFADASPVITEAYSEWVLSGDFPAGRPRWETAGAVFTDDLEPFERRKLRMLNGAHTLLAISGLRRGLSTIDEAIAVPELAGLVDSWWREAAQTLPADLDADAYADALRVRFANPRLRHRLSQIAENMTAKIESRIVPVMRELEAKGLPCPTARQALVEWGRGIDEGVLPGGSAASSTNERVRAMVPDL